MRELSLSECLFVNAASKEDLTNHQAFEYQQQFVGVLFGAAIMSIGGGLLGYYVASEATWVGIKIAASFMGAYGGFVIGRVVGPNLLSCP